ncbi:MAG: type II toxin-antitoxin system VapC family toxin [Thaumarchaeota archaeon]|nr:MAG: type II toxin-antitoxin system VapC family toxin [Nitrososphaerota archaeon]
MDPGRPDILQVALFQEDWQERQRFGRPRPVPLRWKSLIFVDTGAWYASEVEDDVNHAAARKFLAKMSTGTHGVPLTTDHVLDEAITLLRSRRNLATAASFIDKVRSSKSVRIVWVDARLVRQSHRTVPQF